MNYKLIKPTNLKDISPFVTTFSTENIIVDLTELEITLSEIISFKDICNTNTSFVIINSNIAIEKIPEEINIVPTLQEAIDIIDMEEMMRDLE